MALHSQTSSPLSDFGLLVRRRMWSILLPFAFVTALGVMFAQLMPRQYTVRTQIKLPEVSMLGTATAIQRDVVSAKNDLIAEPLVRAVIESQEWSDFVGLREKEKIEFVKRVVSNTRPNVTTAKNFAGSSYITVTYTDSEGTRAERFLNALCARYIDGVVQTVRATAKATVAKLKDLRYDALTAYQEAEKQRATLAKQHNLLAPQGAAAATQARGGDPIYARLVQSENDLRTAELELDKQQNSLELTRALYEIEPESVPESEAVAALASVAGAKNAAPVDDAESQARGMELEIFDLREKLKDYRSVHSKYTQIGEQIADLEGKIALLRGESPLSTPTGRSVRFVSNPKRAHYEQVIRDTESAIAGLKVTIASLTRSISELQQLYEQRQSVYLELNMLDSNVDVANTSYLDIDDNYREWLQRLKLLEGPEANPFEVVEYAKDDGIPSAPNVPLVIGVSALLGLALGLGTALAGEFVRNGFRSISDLTRGLATPVLGVVNVITTREEARRTWIRHVMIAASSAVIVGAILWITWAYEHDPLRLLGPGLTQFIDDVRMAFRP